MKAGSFRFPCEALWSFGDGVTVVTTVIQHAYWPLEGSVGIGKNSSRRFVLIFSDLFEEVRPIPDSAVPFQYRLARACGLQRLGNTVLFKNHCDFDSHTLPPTHYFETV